MSVDVPGRAFFNVGKITVWIALVGQWAKNKDRAMKPEYGAGQERTLAWLKYGVGDYCACVRLGCECECECECGCKCASVGGCVFTLIE